MSKEFKRIAKSYFNTAEDILANDLQQLEAEHHREIRKTNRKWRRLTVKRDGDIRRHMEFLQTPKGREYVREMDDVLKAHQQWKDTWNRKLGLNGNT